MSVGQSGALLEEEGSRSAGLRPSVLPPKGHCPLGLIYFNRGGNICAFLKTKKAGTCEGSLPATSPGQLMAHFSRLLRL